MAKKTRMYFSFSRAMYIFFASALLAQEPQTISGTLTDINNDPVVQNTILLLKPDGTEHKRTETSKKRLGRGGGKFEFKDVEPGSYTLQSDGGELGLQSSGVCPGSWSWLCYSEDFSQNTALAIINAKKIS